jgi:hypothetical protein
MTFNITSIARFVRIGPGLQKSKYEECRQYCDVINILFFLKKEQHFEREFQYWYTFIWLTFVILCIRVFNRINCNVSAQ